MHRVLQTYCYFFAKQYKRMSTNECNDLVGLIFIEIFLLLLVAEFSPHLSNDLPNLPEFEVRVARLHRVPYLQHRFHVCAIAINNDNQCNSIYDQYYASLQSSDTNWTIMSKNMKKSEG